MSAPMLRVASVLRTEGVHGLAERLRERWDERRRRRSFRAATESTLREAARDLAVVNILPFSLDPSNGGVAIALAARLDSERHRRPVALLAPGPRGWRLELETPARRLVLRAGESFEGALTLACEILPRAVLHFENLAGLDPDLVAGKTRDRAVVLSAHDFALFCPRPNLVERTTGFFCGFCRDRPRCAHCLAAADGTVEAHRSGASRLAAAAIAIVHPSDWSRERHLELFPELRSGSQAVIAPASGADPGAAADPPRWPPQHVAFVGQAAPHKGIDTFLAAAGRLRARHPGVRWSVLGGVGPSHAAQLRRLGVEALGYYRARTLGDRLRRSAIDLAVLPSRFPETYSLVLDDCSRSGVPVVSAAIGALGPRTRALSAGWTFDPAGGVDALVSTLDALLSGEATSRAPATAAVASVARSAELHLELYERLGSGSVPRASGAG
ncbi:MAG: glycosyltransferase [Thermoanaerobaculia bacterium]